MNYCVLHVILCFYHSFCCNMNLYFGPAALYYRINFIKYLIQPLTDATKISTYLLLLSILWKGWLITPMIGRPVDFSYTPTNTQTHCKPSVTIPFTSVPISPLIYWAVESKRWTNTYSEVLLIQLQCNLVTNKMWP